jgi:hypothetical protein
MKEMITLNTKIERGAVIFNSPTNYDIVERRTGDGITNIRFQKGPVKEDGLNGIFIEDLLLIVKDQLEHFQASEFACEENEDTLRHVRNALHVTRSRQYERTLRNVQGLNLK